MREESLNVKGDCCCYCCCWRSKPTVKCLNRKSFHTLNLTLVLTRAREFSRLFYDCVSTEFSCGDLALTVLIYTHSLQFRNNFLHPGFLSCPFFPCNIFSKSVIDNLFFNVPLFSGYWNLDFCVNWWWYFVIFANIYVSECLSTWKLWKYVVMIDYFCKVSKYIFTLHQTATEEDG